ncbi:uncharacterized protein LOC131233523 isoform X2 [Magnolia sinica]|uniref:uncharacterized protein LOC131233523 isoform X2 n=1 Tax=Magnolia sinica TaxID=86752 RepID=UPI002658562C|nr:uncharacterized protein LOC131233523 isoform X2 [Magnolia sinica]
MMMEMRIHYLSSDPWCLPLLRCKLRIPHTIIGWWEICPANSHCILCSHNVLPILSEPFIERKEMETNASDGDSDSNFIKIKPMEKASHSSLQACW